MRYVPLLLAVPINAALTAPLPSRFEADRVFATPTTAKGETLRLYTDTGGGMNLLCRETAQRLHLPIESVPPDAQMEAELGKDLARTQLPHFAPGKSIPVNADGDANFLVHDCKNNERFGEGLLSQHWFAGRIWTWDYPAQRLSRRGARRRTRMPYRSVSARPAVEAPLSTCRGSACASTARTSTCCSIPARPAHRRKRPWLRSRTPLP
jgi:hypothetical protein